MQARKLFIKRVDDFSITRVRALVLLIHECYQSNRSANTSLPSLRFPARLFQNRTKASAAEAESTDDVSLDADSRAFGRHSVRSRDPDSSRAIVKFVRALAHDAVAVRHAPDDADLFVAVATWIGVDLRNGRLTRAGG